MTSPEQRRQNNRDRAFGTDGKYIWIVGHPCDVPFCRRPPLSDPSHIRTQGARGLPEHLVPHCCEHHQLFHDKGRDSVGKLWGQDLWERARFYEWWWQSLRRISTNKVPLRKLLLRQVDGLSVLSARIITEQEECILALVQAIRESPDDFARPQPTQAINLAARLLERGGVDPTTGERWER